MWTRILGGQNASRKPHYDQVDIKQLVGKDSTNRKIRTERYWLPGSLHDLEGSILSQSPYFRSFHYNHPSRRLEPRIGNLGYRDLHFQQRHMITGKTSPSFLRYQRVERAKRLMIQTNRSLIAI